MVFNHGSMGCFKSLGYCWCLGLASIASLDLAQDYSSDLNLINAYLANIDSDTSDIFVEVEEISRDVQHMRDSFIDFADDANDILVLLTRVSDTTSNNGFLRVRDDNLGSILTNINNRLTEHFSSYDHSVGDVTNLLSQSVDIQAVQTNQLAAILEALQTPAYFPTNLVPLLEIVSPAYSDDPRWLFYYMFGHFPSSSELSAWRSIFHYGISNLPFYDYFMRLSYDGLQDYPDYFRIWEVGDDYSYINHYPFEAMSDAYYYEYGTRPMIGPLNAITNQLGNLVLLITNNLEIANDVITQSTSESGNSYSFTQSFINGVESLSDSFTGTVDTNVAAISTNKIDDVSDSGYQSALSKITLENLSTPFDIELVTTVESINNQAVSFFPTLSNTRELVLDLGEISFFGHSKAVSFTLSRLPDKYFQVQRFMFAFLQLVATLATVYGVYTFVTQDTKV